MWIRDHVHKKSTALQGNELYCNMQKHLKYLDVHEDAETQKQSRYLDVDEDAETEKRSKYLSRGD
jgi:hypothetical protein